MLHKISIVLIVIVGMFTAASFASDPGDYLTAGRIQMFDGTMTGLRAAYKTFDNGIKDTNCSDCGVNRELRFFRALSGTIMLMARDDEGSINSLFELAKEFDIEISGESWGPSLSNEIWSVSFPENERKAFEIPFGAPGQKELKEIFDASFLPEIEKIISDLNSIGDSPEDRFKTFLTPSETRVFFGIDPTVSDPDSRFLSPIEMDYGEVLILKGMLTILKAQIQTQAAYDTSVSEDDPVLEKFYGEYLSINKDFLEPYPSLLKVLPTENDPNDGKAILAQARQDFINGIDYYIQAVNYIKSEDTPVGTDPQNDELLHIDPDTSQVLGGFENIMLQMRNSLANDTVETFVYETRKSYNLYSGAELTGELDMFYGPIGNPDYGVLFLSQGAGVPAEWEIDDFSIEGDELYVELYYEGSSIDYSRDLDFADSILFTPISQGDDDTYKCEKLDENLFSKTGTARGWSGHSSTESWSHTLPFKFTFYGVEYDSVYVSTNGFLDFTDSSSSPREWRHKVRIAPYDNYLSTNQDDSHDIYIDSTDSNVVKFRWVADYYGWECNFSVSLFKNGSIRFDYGEGNQGGGQRVGISNGSPDSSFYLGYGEWLQGMLTGTFNEDQSSITDISFEYWGHPRSGNVDGLSAQMSGTGTESIEIDLNPIYGSSNRYPDPVNPRDLLPAFNDLNYPKPGTLNATFGGIIPQMTQGDWQESLDLQPDGLVSIDIVSSGQIVVDGNMTDWGTDQRVFVDLVGDTWNDPSVMSGADIKETYLAYDGDYLCGAINLQGDIGYENYYYDIILSYSPDDDSSLNTIKLSFYIDEDSYSYVLYHMQSDIDGWTRWEYIETTSFEGAIGTNALEFKILKSDLPGHLAGRYLSVNSECWNSDWTVYNGEDNSTLIKIDGTGTISGTINFPGHSGQAIFVQAFTDLDEPEDSIVARTMITEAGTYTLEGVGIGWEGFVRAYTPVFGFENPFELGCFDIETIVPVSLSEPELNNVNLTLSSPVELEDEVPQSGSIDATCREVDWFAFDAVMDGVYTIEVTQNTALYTCMELYDRDAKMVMSRVYYWNAQEINWTCTDSGRYFVRVYEGNFLPFGGTYEIQMTSEIPKPIIGLSETTIPFELSEAGSATVNIDVFNAGHYTLDWTISGHETVSWITFITPVTGSSTSLNDITTIGLTVDSTSLSFGQYNVELTFTAEDEVDPVALPVSLSFYNRFDLNHDTYVNLSDFAVMSAAWGTSQGDANYNSICELSGDTTINVEDLTIFAQHWLQEQETARSIPIAHWTLDDNAASTAVIDSSFNANNGVASANTNTFSDVSGKVGGCLDLSGTEYIEVSDHSALSFGDDVSDSPFSVSCWVCYNGDSGVQTVISKDGPSGREWNLLFVSNRLWMYLMDDNGGYIYSSTDTVSAGWHFVVATYDGTDSEGLEIYLDGQGADIISSMSGNYVAMSDSNTNVLIGASFDASGVPVRWFQDKLDDIAIYNKELSASEVETLFND